MVIGSKEWRQDALAKAQAIDLIVDRLWELLRPMVWSAISNYLNSPKHIMATPAIKQEVANQEAITKENK